MPEKNTSETSGSKTPEVFCLWKIHSWGEVEQELTEMSGINFPQHEDELWTVPLLLQEPAPGLLVPQNQMLSGWEQPYQQLPPGVFHQHLYEWEQIYDGHELIEAYHGHSMPEPIYFQPENTPPLSPPGGYQITDISVSGPLFTYYFWLGGPIDPYNIPGCSKYLPITVSADMKLTDIFDVYFSKVSSRTPYMQVRNLEFFNFMQVMFRDGKPQQGTQNYYEGAKWTGITVKETQWYSWQKFWLVGSDKEQLFLEACERGKTSRLF